MLDYYMVLNPDPDSNITGVDTIEPTFGLPAKWCTMAVSPTADRRMANCAMRRKLFARGAHEGTRTAGGAPGGAARTAAAGGAAGGAAA